MIDHWPDQILVQFDRIFDFLMFVQLGLMMYVYIISMDEESYLCSWSSVFVFEILILAGWTFEMIAMLLGKPSLTPTPFSTRFSTPTSTSTSTPTSTQTPTPTLTPTQTPTPTPTLTPTLTPRQGHSQVVLYIFHGSLAYSRCNGSRHLSVRHSVSLWVL